MIRVKFHSRITERAQKSSAVRIMAEHRRLAQAGADNGFTQFTGVFFCLRMNDFRFKKRRSALAVSRHHSCKRRIHIIQRFPEFLIIFVFRCDFRIFRHTVCQYDKCVICGSVSVHRYHIEGIDNIFPQSLLKQLFGNRNIRRQKTEHGAHIRMNHAGTFAHAAERRALPADFEGNGRLLGNRIRRHDGFRRDSSRFCRIRFLFCQLLYAVRNFIGRNLSADYARRRHQHGVFRNLQIFRRRLCSLLTALISQRARTGIGNPRIRDNRLCIRGMRYHLFIPDNRSRLDNIARKDSRRHTWLPAVNKRHILSVLIFDGSFHSRRFESLRRSHTAFNYLHKLSTPSVINFVILSSFSTKS